MEADHRCTSIQPHLGFVVQSLSCLTHCDPHGLQHARLPWPSLSLRVCSLTQWCHTTISSSSSVSPFSCPQSFPASGSSPVSQLITSGGQSIGASVSVLRMNIQCWFPLGLTCLISLQSKGLKSLSSMQFESISSLVVSLLYGPTLGLWNNQNTSSIFLPNR